MPEVVVPLLAKMKLSDLDAAGYNPRKIDDDSMRGLRESIARFGLIDVIVVNVHGGKKTIVSGHQRCKALMAEGVVYADVATVSFDEATERMANIAMNNPAVQGMWDVPKALPVVTSLQADLPKPDEARFEALRLELAAEAAKVAKHAEGNAATDDVPEVKAPKSVLGTVYQLGQHRLFAGRFEDGLAKMMKGKKAAACITDPPYNVAYKEGEIENDDMSVSDWAKFMDAICATMLKLTDGPCYVFMASKEIPALAAAFEKNGGFIHRWLIWAKDSFTLSRGDYHHQYEPCLYGYRKGVTVRPPGVRTNVLEFPKPKKNDLHPTMKPTALFQVLMEDATVAGDIVIEPFAGSGTTLVVAESIGRVCYASELDLAHVDTVRKRWAEHVHGAGADWLKLTPAVKAP